MVMSPSMYGGRRVSVRFARSVSPRVLLAPSPKWVSRAGLGLCKNVRGETVQVVLDLPAAGTTLSSGADVICRRVSFFVFNTALTGA